MVLTYVWSAIAVGLAGALAVQTITFLWALHLRRVDVVDIAWGVSFIALIEALQIVSPSSGAVTLLVDILVTIWGLRLSWHIYTRFRRSPKQDERYTAMMAQWPSKGRWVQVFVKIFFLQAVLVTVISLPVILVHLFEPGMRKLVIAGLVVWVIGFAFEAVADGQLKAFLRQSRGGLMKSGLWRYSRHPNYFGEITMWWGVALFACATPLWWLGLIGAGVITYLICFVSGIPLAERRGRMKEDWQAYASKTSILVPWFTQK